MKMEIINHRQGSKSTMVGKFFTTPKLGEFVGEKHSLTTGILWVSDGATQSPCHFLK